MNRIAIQSPELAILIEQRQAQIEYGKRNTASIDRRIADKRDAEHPIAAFVGRWAWRAFAVTSLLIFWGSVIRAFA